MGNENNENNINSISFKYHKNCDFYIRELPFVTTKFNEILQRYFREVSEELRRQTVSVLYLIVGKFLSIKGTQLRHHYCRMTANFDLCSALMALNS